MRTRQTELFEQQMESDSEENGSSFMEPSISSRSAGDTHSKATVKATGQKTREEESNNIKQARHNIMMGNAADEGIIP